MEKNQLKFILVGALLGLVFSLLLLAVGLLGALVISLFTVIGAGIGYFLWKYDLLSEILSKIYPSKR